MVAEPTAVRAPAWTLGASMMTSTALLTPCKVSFPCILYLPLLCLTTALEVKEAVGNLMTLKYFAPFRSSSRTLTPVDIVAMGIRAEILEPFRLAGSYFKVPDTWLNVPFALICEPVLATNWTLDALLSIVQSVACATAGVVLNVQSNEIAHPCIDCFPANNFLTVPFPYTLQSQRRLFESQ